MIGYKFFLKVKRFIDFKWVYLLNFRKKNMDRFVIDCVNKFMMGL